MKNKFYLLGHPLGHSCSPALHAMLDNPDYELIDLEKDAAAFIRQGDYAGLNVTIPYKRVAFDCVDMCSDRARETQVVNTVVRTPQGLYGDNTDCGGMLALIQNAGLSIQGKRVMILGTGATARTAAWVAGKLKAKDILFVSRNGALNYSNLYAEKPDILINTTPVGMKPDYLTCPVDLDKLGRLSGVIDVVFNPLRTRLILSAMERGIPCAGGLFMLVHQAAEAEKLFSGKEYTLDQLKTVYYKLYKLQSNLILIGMPGSGKSTVARLIAEKTGRTLIDTDQLIEQKAGCTIPELFDRIGEQGFRALEKQAMLEACSASFAVIATGGGAVLDSDNRILMRENGFICRLEREMTQLDTSARPLSTDMDALRKLATEREPIYAALADFTVHNVTPEKTAEHIGGIQCEFW